MSFETAKIFNDDSEYLTLLSLSKSQKYSLEYLLQAASQGKLKSFKMGDEWLTTLAWFDDYQRAVKKTIQSEITDPTIDYKTKWVSFVPESRWRLRFRPQLVLILLIFSFFSFILSWLVFSAGGHQLALSTHQWTNQKYRVGAYFLNQTNQVYNYNNDFFLFVINNSIGTINLISYSLTEVGQDSAHLALAVDERLVQYKIADEIITEKFSELANSLKNQYQAVAGTSSIRSQIYFEEWANSVKSDN